MWYLYVGILLALIALIDGLNRKMGGWAVAYAAGCLVLWPIVAPLYFARRSLKAGAIRKGGTFWNWVKGFVAVWTIAMMFWGGYAMIFSGDQLASAEAQTSDAYAVGTLLGGGFVITTICGIWLLPTLVLLVLGLVLRSDNVEEGPTGPLAEIA